MLDMLQRASESRFFNNSDSPFHCNVQVANEKVNHYWTKRKWQEPAKEDAFELPLQRQN